MIYLELFLTFLQIGAVSFGGGYGMISLIREEVLTHGWLTEKQLLDMIVIYDMRFFLSVDNIYTNTRFLGYLPDDSFTVPGITHSGRGTGAIIHYIIYFH